MDDDDWSDDLADDKGSDHNAAHDWFGNGSTTGRTAGVAGAAAGAAGFWATFRKRDAVQGNAAAAGAPLAAATGIGVQEIQWHYAVAGQSLGPERESVIRERLARRELAEDTLVWNSQLPNWCSARVAGLMVQPAVQSVPPPVLKPAAAKLWHYVSAGQATGPVSEDELRALLARGALSGATLVWNSTLVDWRSATDAGLTVPHAPAPQPVAQCSRCHGLLELGARFCTGCGEPVAAVVAAPRARTCPRCTAAIELENRFCTECGMALR